MSNEKALLKPGGPFLCDAAVDVDRISCWHDDIGAADHRSTGVRRSGGRVIWRTGADGDLRVNVVRQQKGKYGGTDIVPSLAQASGNGTCLLVTAELSFGAKKHA